MMKSKAWRKDYGYDSGADTTKVKIDEEDVNKNKEA